MLRFITTAHYICYILVIPSLLKEAYLSFLWYIPVYFFFLENCAIVKKDQDQTLKEKCFLHRQNGKTFRVPVVNLCCEHNTWTISEGTTPTNNKRMARHGTAPFACSSGPERSIWSPKDGNPCKSRQLQTRQTLDWHSCIFVQVKELANLFYFSEYSVFLKYCILNDILMLQRVLSYILRYMHIGNLLKKNRTYPAHIFVKGISSELLYFF